MTYRGAGATLRRDMVHHIPSYPAQYPAQTDFADLLFEGRELSPSLSLVRETLPPLPQYLPVYGVKLVRTDVLTVRELPRIGSPRDVANLVWSQLQHSDREQVLALLIDTKGGVIGVNIVSVGDLSSAIIHPREVFKPAILANAASLIIAHNHPSGDPTPSPEDIAITRRIADAGNLLGIELMDHVVVGSAGRWTSLREKGHF